LIRLYDDSDNVASMSNFTSRFLQRFAQMAMDKDNNTAAAAVRLVTVLLQ
jgi:hypothetical protein